MTRATRVPRTLAPAARDLLQRAAAAAAPAEACGILAGEVAVELPNRSTRRDTFHVYAEDLAEACTAVGGWATVTAIWHSHPRGHATPSDPDLDHHPAGPLMVIVTPEEVYWYAIDIEA